VCELKERELLREIGRGFIVRDPRPSADSPLFPSADAFEAMMMREECAKGFVVAFDYSSDAKTEISRFFKQTGKVIVPFTVQEILEEELAHKLA
jgi:hypothetical protein